MTRRYHHRIWGIVALLLVAAAGPVLAGDPVPREPPHLNRTTLPVPISYTALMTISSLVSTASRRIELLARRYWALS